MKNIKIRNAINKDIKDIFLWRNDKNTRKNSFNKNFIEFEEHKKWYLESLRDKKKIIYIGLNKEKKIGMTRFDYIQNNTFEVSINLNPKFRGVGFGKILLYNSLKKIFYKKNNLKIVSKVLIKNFKSKNLFKKIGFKVKRKNKNFIVYDLIEKRLNQLN